MSSVLVFGLGPADRVALVAADRRLLEPIGNIPPAEAEERYQAVLDEQKLPA